MQIEIRKPPIRVNADNFRYLQILDAIRELDMAPVDTAKPVDVVRATVQKFAVRNGSDDSDGSKVLRAKDFSSDDRYYVGG